MHGVTETGGLFLDLPVLDYTTKIAAVRSTANVGLFLSHVSHYVSGMGKGLSTLQKDILAVLEEFPSREDFPEHGFSITSWARRGQILKRLGRPPTASNRVAISKALARLEQLSAR
jgi:hypothetical protein